MRVSKWGNSLAVRLPAAVVEALNLSEGDEVQIEAVSERELRVRHAPTTEDLLATLRQFRGRLPKDFRFDREEANAR